VWCLNRPIGLVHYQRRQYVRLQIFIYAHVFYITFKFLSLYSALVGDIDEEIESRIDYENLKAAPLATITH
jgi:hypothetical protein